MLLKSFEVIEMKWTLQELKKFQDEMLRFDETLDLEQSLKERDRDIIAVAPIHATGTIEVLSDAFLVSINIETTVTLPSTRSLEPVEVSLSVPIEEIYQTREQMDSHALRPEFAEDVMELTANQIDLIPAIEDHLLLALPLQVLSEEEKKATELPKGDSWQILTEDDYQRQKQAEKESTIDPRLAKLSDLLDKDDDGASLE